MDLDIPSHDAAVTFVNKYQNLCDNSPKIRVWHWMAYLRLIRVWRGCWTDRNILAMNCFLQLLIRMISYVVFFFFLAYVCKPKQNNTKEYRVC